MKSSVYAAPVGNTTGSFPFPSFPSTSSPSSYSEEERSLFLGDLSCFCQEQDVFNLFCSFGEIDSIRLMRSKTTQKCLGYGFITFADINVLPRAMKLYGIVFMGRKLKIGLANPRKTTPVSAKISAFLKEIDRNRVGNKDSYSNSAQVHFSYLTQHLSPIITEETIRNIFIAFGEVDDVTIKKSSIDHSTHSQSGYGFIHFPLNQEGILAAVRATSAIRQVLINEVLYDSCLTRSLVSMLQANGTPTSVSSSETAYLQGMICAKPLPTNGNRVTMGNNGGFGGHQNNFGYHKIPKAPERPIMPRYHPDMMMHTNSDNLSFRSYQPSNGLTNHSLSTYGQTPMHAFTEEGNVGRGLMSHESVPGPFSYSPDHTTTVTESLSVPSGLFPRESFTSSLSTLSSESKNFSGFMKNINHYPSNHLMNINQELSFPTNLPVPPSPHEPSETTLQKLFPVSVEGSEPSSHPFTSSEY